jgi:hypothetical protein
MEIWIGAARKAPVNAALVNWLLNATDSVGWNDQSCRQMPSGLINKKDGVGSW